LAAADHSGEHCVVEALAGGFRAGTSFANDGSPMTTLNASSCFSTYLGTRSDAIAVDVMASEQIELSALWSHLASGSLKVDDHFCDKHRCYAVLAQAEAVSGDPPSTRGIAWLERFLLGESQKSVAIDSEFAPSTVACALGRSLRLMGISSCVGRIPLLLAMAVHASHGKGVIRTGRISRIQQGGVTRFVVSVTRPDGVLSTMLSPAELDVARLIVEGRTHAEVAVLRRRSVRTIANQLTTVFRKLGISGRAELLRYVCTPVRKSERPPQSTRSPFFQAGLSG